MDYTVQEKEDIMTTEEKSVRIKEVIVIHVEDRMIIYAEIED